jgi:5-hydroxyisourate hydrolase
MAGSLTTHVLDTANGCPAAGMTVTLWELNPVAQSRNQLKSVQTNQDGRADAPLLGAGEFKAGMYELVFEVGRYFQQQGAVLPKPFFLDQVPIRFGVADGSAHYHVPLLVSPWAYSTYRGS